MRTLAFVEQGSTSPGLLHLVDSDAQPGRIRRVEYLRRGHDDQAVVVGPLQGECRCAGFGLDARGSALPRTLGPVLGSLGVGPHGSIHPCSWSWPVARHVAELGLEQVLVASGPPPEAVRRVQPEGVNVLAPDAESAEAWDRCGVRSVQVLPPCALAAQAPVVGRGTGSPALRVGIFCDEVRNEEEALLMLHRFGVVALTEHPFLARLSRQSPYVSAMLSYARKVGIEHCFEVIDESSFPGEIDVAMVPTVGAARSSEQVLDLAARGVVSITFTPLEDARDRGSLAVDGIVECSTSLTNAGAVHLLALIEDPGLLRSARDRVSELGRSRPLAEWVAGFRHGISSVFSPA